MTDAPRFDVIPEIKRKPTAAQQFAIPPRVETGWSTPLNDADARHTLARIDAYMKRKSKPQEAKNDGA